MCDSPELLAVLGDIKALLKEANTTGPGVPFIDQDYNISATVGFFLDYKQRHHLYLFSPTAFTLLLPDIGGQIAISANTWTDITYRPGLQIFASSAQTTMILVKVRATNETIAGASSGGGGGGGGAVTAAAGSYSVGWSSEFTEVAADTDEMVTSLAAIAAQTTLTPVVSGTITEANSAAILAALDDGQENMGASISVAIASDQSPIAASTGVQSIVASSAASVTILAANANRRGALIWNDSTQILYILLVTGGTASTTVYTLQIAPQQLFDLQRVSVYTGAIIGIWASANGNARVTELTL
jgi:hypothetical protein